MTSLRYAHSRLWLSSRFYRLGWFGWPAALALAATAVIWGASPDRPGSSSAPWAATDQAGPSPIDHPSPQKETGKYVTGRPLFEVFFENTFKVGDIEVPLPAGKWIVMNAGHYNKDGWDGAIYNLMNIEGKNIKKAVHIQVGDYTLPSPPGLPLNPKCTRDNIDNIAFESISCEDRGLQIFWFISNYWTVSWNEYSTSNNRLDRFDVDLAKVITARGYKYPNNFLYYKFNYDTKTHFIDVTYEFAVPNEITSQYMTNYRDSEWHNMNIGDDLEKRKFVDELKVMAKYYWPIFIKACEAAVR